MKTLFTLCFFFSFLNLFAFSEQLPWVMNTELPAKGIFRDEEECAVMGQRGRLYRGGGSNLGFMNYVCQLNDRGTVDKKYFFNHVSSMHNESQVIYYARNKKYYAGILSPLTDRVLALEFDDPHKAYNLVFVWTYLKLQELNCSATVRYLPHGYWTDRTEPLVFPPDAKGLYGKPYTLYIVKDSDKIYDTICRQSYYYCDACTKYNHGDPVIELRENHYLESGGQENCYKKVAATIRHIYQNCTEYPNYGKDY